MGENGIDSRLPVVAIVLLAGIGYLFYSYAPTGLSTLFAIVFGPAALLVVIWGLARLSATIGSS